MNTTPAQVFHLAEHLCDEMEARNWTTWDVAQRMGEGRDRTLDKLTLDLILAVAPMRENIQIDNDTFAGLSVAFGISVEYFKNLHKGWLDNPKARSPFVPDDKFFGVIILGVPH